jgi:hypothetical protein
MGEITQDVARQMAVDSGDLRQEYLALMGSMDRTPNIVVDDDQHNVDITVEDNILTGKHVALPVAWETAKYIRNIVEESDVQIAIPLSKAKLDTWEQSLRNKVRTGYIGTGDHWQTSAITESAMEAGIHPHNIRLRLPDNVRLLVTPDQVRTNKGDLIYRHIERRYVKSIQKPDNKLYLKGKVCYTCGKDPNTHRYIATKGWYPVCSAHAVGITSDEKPQDLEAILALTVPYNNTHTRGQINASLALAYDQGRAWKSKDIHTLQEYVNKAMTLVEFGLYDALPLLLCEIYLMGKV